MELDSTASLSIADENYRFPKGTNVTGLDRIIKSRRRKNILLRKVLKILSFSDLYVKPSNLEINIKSDKSKTCECS